MKNIKKSKIKLLFIILFMILIFILGIIFILNPSEYISFVFRNEMIMLVIGIISIIFSTYCIYQFGSKLLNRNTMVLINSNGISDKVNILDYPFVSWRDVAKIEECKINNVPHLIVFVNNPQYYINQKSGLKRWVLNFNYQRYQTPILLNSTYLVCSFNEFKRDILNSYTEYKG